MFTQSQGKTYESGWRGGTPTLNLRKNVSQNSVKKPPAPSALPCATPSASLRRKFARRQGLVRRAACHGPGKVEPQRTSRTADRQTPTAQVERGPVLSDDGFGAPAPDPGSGQPLPRGHSWGAVRLPAAGEPAVLDAGVAVQRPVVASEQSELPSRRRGGAAAAPGRRDG